jgi:DNA-binding NarL/FixJ family response regulator
MCSLRLASVLLADDHIVFTDGIVRILGDHFDVVGTVRDGNLLVEAATRLRPDVIVSDISMPAVSGLEGLRQLKAHRIESRMIFLTMHGDAKLAAEAFRLGARGFVLKQSSGDELIKAIQAVLEGHKYMSAALTEDVLSLMSEPPTSPDRGLSSRQKEVLRLIVNGHRMKEIAATLNLSPRTVETIKYGMMRDLKLHSTTELVKYAIEHRLVVF